MDGTATRDIESDDVIDEARYLSDINYRRRVHQDLQIEGDEPIDLSPHSEEDLAFNGADYPSDEAATEALKKFLDDILAEVLNEIAAEGRAHSARP